MAMAMMTARNKDRVVYASRSFTEYRDANGRLYTVKHPPKMRPKPRYDRFGRKIRTVRRFNDEA